MLSFLLTAESGEMECFYNEIFPYKDSKDSSVDVLQAVRIFLIRI